MAFLWQSQSWSNEAYVHLKRTSKNSTSVESDSNIKRYQRRPYTMNKYCLADFVALHYTKKGSKNEQNLQSSTESEDLPESHYEMQKMILSLLK